MGYNRQKNKMKRTIIALMLAFSISAIFAQNNRETVIGSVYLEVNAGEHYELYKSSLDSFLDFLKGWIYLGVRDNMVVYSYGELYAKLKAEALRKYGSSYPDLYLKDFYYEDEIIHLPDVEYQKSVRYKRTDRAARIFKCSATVVVEK